MKKSVITSLILATILFLILGTLAVLSTYSNPSLLGAKIIWVGFIAFIGYLIFHQEKISRYRSLMFIIMAWAFLLEFKANLIGLGGNAFFVSETQEVPYCHIAIASTFLDFVYNQYLALTSGHWEIWGPLSLGLLWLVVTLTIGQGWCAWGCFYGGFDEGFSKIFRRPLFRFNLPRRLRDFPAALLLFLILISFTASLPIFCLWLCPLKITTGFLDPISTIRKIQLVLFVAIGIVFLILLPILTKKRTFCGLICPFGAWQSFFGRINPYRVTIDPQKCNQCRKCLQTCPTLAIDQTGLSQYKISSYCNRCGKCIDICPTQAIRFTVWGKSLNLPDYFPRIIREICDVNVWFVFAAFLVSGAISNLFVPSALLRVSRAIFELW